MTVKSIDQWRHELCHKTRTCGAQEFALRILNSLLDYNMACKGEMTTDLDILQLANALKAWGNEAVHHELLVTRHTTRLREANVNFQEL